jgi:hypothetical protein
MCLNMYNYCHLPERFWSMSTTTNDVSSPIRTNAYNVFRCIRHYISGTKSSHFPHRFSAVKKQKPYVTPSWQFVILNLSTAVQRISITLIASTFFVDEVINTSHFLEICSEVTCMEDSTIKNVLDIQHKKQPLPNCVVMSGNTGRQTLTLT